MTVGTNAGGDRALPNALPDLSPVGEGTPLLIEESEFGSGGSAAGDGSQRVGDPPTTLAELTAPLGSAQVDFDQLAADIEEQAAGPRPDSISIPSLGVANAAVTSVGVEPNGDMEIPPADQVGWYRYGPRPGEPGSAVLAGHIAYDGVDGVFRHLADLEIGTTFSIGFTDGSASEYLVTDRQTYLKTELPRDELFDRDGAPRLVLVTCGGSFNYDASSYESNVVAYAVPLEPIEPAGQR